MKFDLSPAAERDIEDIGDYIAQDNRFAALRVVQQLRDKFEALTAMPFMGIERPDLDKGIRMVPSGNCIILYRVSNGIRVERVLHGARDLDGLYG